MNIIFFITILMFTTVGQAEVYKWVDDNGNVHYGDRAQSGKGAKQININTAPSLPQSSTPEDELTRTEKRQRITDAMEEDRLIKKQNREKKKAERERQRIKCNRLKDKQRQFRRARGLYNLDSDGNRVYLSHDERKKNEKRLQNNINKTCR